MFLKVTKYPDAALRKKGSPVEKLSEDVFKLVDDMIETMIIEEGFALAANQVGSLFRVFVINTTPHEDTPKLAAFINPEILNQEGTVVEEEGCLSFPKLYLRIKRADKIRIRAKNLYNENLIYETNGLLARAIQHETDHLNGILFIDHVDKAEEEKVKKYLDSLNSSGMHE